MSPSELVLSRVINMGGKEFVSKDICYAEYNMSLNSLRSTFKRLVIKEARGITTRESGRQDGLLLSSEPI